MSLDIYIVANKCPHCGRSDRIGQTNITHNLNNMADLAGLYDPLWHPELIGMRKVADLIPELRRGIAELKSDPDKFRPLSAPNGWGTYEQFVPWLEELLETCKDAIAENPNAEYEVIR